MKLQTKYFGEIDYEPAESIRFPAGMFGFDDEHDFLLLPFEGSGHSMLCLQSIATPALAFILLDPFSLCPDYTPVLRKTELELFAVEDTGALCFYVLCAVKNPVAASTVGTNEARQIIMETEAYDMRHPLADFGRGEEGATC